MARRLVWLVVNRATQYKIGVGANQPNWTPSALCYTGAMQLDQTRIPIRERTYFNVLDLALRVSREHAAPLMVTTLLGAGPMFLFNTWLIGPYDPTSEPLDPAWGFVRYATWLTLLVLWQIPLASAPTTLYLGQVLFMQKPEPRRLAGLYLKSLPQLLFFQAFLRGLFTLFCGFAVFMHWFWPYLTEVILLERNPFTSGRTGISTMKRAQNLHAYNAGDLFGRWMLATAIGFVWIVALWLALFSLRSLLTGETSFATEWLGYNTVWVLLLQVAVWLVIAFFNVARFLSYLDLRIRNEGWEVELRLRAESARLARSLT